MQKRLNNKTRLIILGAKASFAAFPVVGVFAASGTTVTDTVQVTIEDSCTITTTNASNTYSATMTNNQLKSDLGSTSMTITCNDASGWHLTAKAPKSSVPFLFNYKRYQDCVLMV